MVWPRIWNTSRCLDRFRTIRNHYASAFENVKHFAFTHKHTTHIFAAANICIIYICIYTYRAGHCIFHCRKCCFFLRMRTHSLCAHKSRSFLFSIVKHKSAHFKRASIVVARTLRAFCHLRIYRRVVKRTLCGWLFRVYTFSGPPRGLSALVSRFSVMWIFYCASRARFVHNMYISCGIYTQHQLGERLLFFNCLGLLVNRVDQ